MRRLLTKLAAVCGVALSAGCAATIAGTVEPARDSAGIIGIGRSIPDILPTDTELHDALRSRVQTYGFPPSVGGPGLLKPGWNLAGKQDQACLGVVSSFVKSSYEGTSVRAVAQQDWSGVETRFWVDAGAVALASPRDAKALFTRLIGRWQRCKGKAVVRQNTDEAGMPEYRNDVTDVDTADGMLTAVVTLTVSNSDAKPFPSERTLALAYNCIIDIEVTDFDWRDGDPSTAEHARAVAALMVAKAGGFR